MNGTINDATMDRNKYLDCSMFNGGVNAGEDGQEKHGYEATAERAKIRTAR